MQNPISKFSAAVLALALLAPVHAAPAKIIRLPDGADTIVMPASSTLTLHGFDKSGAALFDGTVTLTGTWYYSNDVHSTGDLGPWTAAFVPDAASLARLPHFKTHVSDMTILDLDGADALAAAMLPKDKLASLHKATTIQLVTGKAGIKLDHFKAWLSCGNDNYAAHFAGIATPTQKFTAEELPSPDC